MFVFENEENMKNKTKRKKVSVENIFRHQVTKFCLGDKIFPDEVHEKKHYAGLSTVTDFPVTITEFWEICDVMAVK